MSEKLNYGGLSAEELLKTILPSMKQTAKQFIDSEEYTKTVKETVVKSIFLHSQKNNLEASDKPIDEYLIEKTNLLIDVIQKHVNNYDIENTKWYIGTSGDANSLSGRYNDHEKEVEDKDSDHDEFKSWMSIESDNDQAVLLAEKYFNDVMSFWGGPPVDPDVPPQHHLYVYRCYK